MHASGNDSNGSREQADALRSGISALVRRFSLSERADVACCGMTVAQAATLGVLRDGGPLRLGELGARLGVRPSTLTRNLVRLEERGLIRRGADPRDARAAIVRLTARGRGAAARVERQEAEFAETVLQRLPVGRRKEILRSLRLLLGAVREATQTCCPGAFDHLMEGFPAEDDTPQRSTP